MLQNKLKSPSWASLKIFSSLLSLSSVMSTSACTGKWKRSEIPIGPRPLRKHWKLGKFKFGWAQCWRKLLHTCSRCWSMFTVISLQYSFHCNQFTLSFHLFHWGANWHTVGIRLEHFFHGILIHSSSRIKQLLGMKESQVFMPSDPFLKES